VEHVKSGGARDPRGIRLSPVEHVKGGGGNARTRTLRQAPLTPCSYLWVPHGRPVSTEMQAHARHPMDQGGRGGYNPNALHQGARPRAHRQGRAAPPIW